jgi:hypothetical protein
LMVFTWLMIEKNASWVKFEGGELHFSLAVVY